MKTQHKTNDGSTRHVNRLAMIFIKKMIGVREKWAMEQNKKELLKLGDHLLRDTGHCRECLEKDIR